jgi:hypothetical protein
MYTMVVCTCTSEAMGHQRELWQYIVDLVQVGKDQLIDLMHQRASCFCSVAREPIV